jgi:hypothetical protein
MGTPLDDYESNSSGNAIIYQELLNKTNVSSLDNLESAVVNNRNLSNMTTNSLLNNIGTDPESMDRLNIEQQELETSRTNMLNKKTALMNQKSDLQKKEVSIDGKITNLETWIQDHPFEMWNYANKINKIEVHYTSFGITGIRSLYRDQNKAPEIIGVVTNINGSLQTTVQTVNFTDDEWLVQAEITISNDSLKSVICKSISFYTSKNLPGTPPKITIPPSSPNNIMKNKIYYIDGTPRTWLQHKSNAEAQGATLACFENSIEINKMLSELGQDRFRYGSYYIGLYHPNALKTNNNSGGGIRNNVISNKISNWAWVDGTPYNPNSTNWNVGEPNNWGPGENVGQMYSNGKINDLTKTNRLVAIYQKKIKNLNIQAPRKPGQHITGMSGKVTYDSITSPDIVQKTNAESSVKISKQAVDEIESTSKILDKSIKDVDDAIAEITINIEHIKSKRILLDKLNADGEKILQNFEGFTNGGTNFLSSNTSYIGMREGAANRNETTNNDSQNGAIDALTTTNDAINDTSKEILDGVIELEQQEIGDAISEYVIKKDNIFTNVLTDYMLNDEKQNTIESVYDKVSQQNADKMRKMEINTYYDKVYKEYTNILKVIIVVCIVLVPIVIANKKEILPTAISNFLIIGIIFLTIIYIIYKFIDIYMRDNTNFDKLRIPYDREAASLQRSGTITRKNNLLSSFARTCIGEDCCPDPASGMVFDTVKNRCVAKETYADYNNGSVSGVYLDETFNGYFDGLLGKSDQQVPYSIVQPFMTREELSGASLNLSSDTKMMA